MAWFRKQMWLDVEGGWCGWIDTPNSGADASATGWQTSGTLLNGQGYATHSWGSHKRYVFEWSGASAHRNAQLMKSLRDGTLGRGLIHFIEPTLYGTNILPARWADPSITVGDDGPSLVPGVEPLAVPTPGWTPDSALPVRTTVYNMNDIPSGYPGDWASLYVPIPEGYTLLLGATYTATGSARIFVRDVETGVDTPLPQGSLSGPAVASEFSGTRGVRIWIGKTAPGAASLQVTAMCARAGANTQLFAGGYGDLPYGEGPYGGVNLAYWDLVNTPWMGGMGNAGVRFDGVPTLIHNTGVNGGQVGYAASFIETGGW